MSSDRNSNWMDALVGFWFAMRSSCLRRKVDNFWDSGLVKKDLD